MRIRTRSLLVSTVVLGLVASACTGDDDDAATTTTGAEEEDTETEATEGSDLDGDGLTIGFIRPPAGLFDLLGAAQAGALELAAEDIAVGGGVLGGPLTVVEGQPEPARGAELVFDDLVDDDIRLIVGPSSSDEARLIIPKIAGADAVVCGASTTAPGLPELPEAEGRFVRTSFDDNIVALHAFDRIRERTAAILDRPPKVSLVVRGDSYGDGISGTLAGLLGLVGTEVAVERYVPEDVLAEGLGDRVAALGGDIVIIVGLEESPRISRLMQEAGVDPTTMIGLDGLATPRFGAKAGIEEPNVLDGLTAIGATGPIDFLTRLAEMDESREEVLYGAQAYDCAISLALAVEAAGTTDGGAVSTALRDVTGDGTICTTYADCAELLRAGEDIDYDGPSGSVDLTDEGEPGGGRFITGKLSNGTFDIVSDLRIALEEIRDRVAPRLAGFIGDIQVALTQLGYYTGPINGAQNDEFTAAVAAFQTDAGLEPTGELDAATIAAIQDTLAEQGLLLGASVAEVQQVLTDLGYYTGPIDGRFTQDLSDAIAAFQTDLGLEPTGILDAATLRAIFAAGVKSGQEVVPPVTTTPPASTTTTTAPASTTTVPAATTTVAATTTTVAATTTTAAVTASIYDVLATQPTFSELVALLDLPAYAAVKTVLSDPAQSITLLAPTNDALPDDIGSGDVAAVTRILLYHGLAGRFDAAALTPGTYDTLLDDAGTIATVAVTASSGSISITDASGATVAVIAPNDLIASNGIVHALGGVLTPPAAP